MRQFYPSCITDMSKEVMKPGAVTEWKQLPLIANAFLHSITKIPKEYQKQLKKKHSGC